MGILLALAALAGAQEAREERGRYSLRCFGKEAGTEEYRLEEFDDGHVVLFSNAKWAVDVLGEKREFQVDAVLTMEKSFAPIRYAGFHKSGKQQELVKVEWQKGVAVPDGRKPVRTAAPFVLDHNAVSQLVPLLRRLDGRKKVLVFRPSAMADAEVSVTDRGDVLLRGPEGEVRVRERVLALGPLAWTVHVDGKGRVLRAWNGLQGTLAELEGYEGWVPAPAPERPGKVEEQAVSFKGGRGPLSGTLVKPGDAKGCAAVLLLGDDDLLRPAAAALAAAGLLALRLDGRESGESPLGDLVADARAAVGFLRGREDVASVSLAGHGEGALVATLVAGREPSIRSLALLGASGKTPDAALLEAAARNLRAQGTAEAVVTAMLEKERRTFDAIRRSTGDTLEIDERRTHVARMRERLLEDPAAALRKVSVPVAILQGSRDEGAHAVLLKAAKPEADVRILEGLDHGFRGADRAVSPEFLKALPEVLRPSAPR